MTSHLLALFTYMRVCFPTGRNNCSLSSLINGLTLELSQILCALLEQITHNKVILTGLVGQLVI